VVTIGSSSNNNNNNRHQWAPATILTGACLVAGLFALLLPTETGFGRGLDRVDEKEEEMAAMVVAAAVRVGGEGKEGEDGRCSPSSHCSPLACLPPCGGVLEEGEGGWDVEMATPMASLPFFSPSVVGGEGAVERVSAKKQEQPR
jgi:hypothetical protein